MADVLAELGRYRHGSCVTLTDAVRCHAEQRGDQVALASDDRRVTYAQFERRSSQIAGGLRAAGVGPGARVAFLDMSSVEFFEVMVACLKLGAVVVPLNWRLTPAELEMLLVDMAADVILVGDAFSDRINPGKTYSAKVITVGSPPHGQIAFEAWLEEFSPIDDIYRPLAEDIAIQIYSSGTTGVPKGVMLSHRAYHFAMGLENERWVDWQNWSSHEVALVPTPLFHVGGVNWGIRSLFYGATTYLMKKFDAGRTIELIEQLGVTRIPLVPASLHALIDHPLIQSAEIGSIRHLQYGASPIDEALLERVITVLDCNMVQSYGLTETAFGVVALSPEDHKLTPDARYLATGRPLPGVNLRIVDPDGAEVLTGQVGEILIRTPSMMSGYWRRPEETARVLDAEGWLHTGDAGYVDGDGYLYVSGRLKEIIITGGENVFPGEVENALGLYPSVSEVAVFARPSMKWGEEVSAAIVPKNGETVDIDRLVEFAQQKIAQYKLPKSIAFVEELPRNAGGKVLRGELKNMAHSGSLRMLPFKAVPHQAETKS